MKLQIEWTRPIVLKDGRKSNLIYTTDLAKLPTVPGIYLLGRRWGTGFEALYVGKANDIRARVKGQFNNLRLMQHLKNTKTGRRILLTGRVVTRRGQQIAKCLDLVERTLIRHFLSEGHDLVNIQGTHLRRHELVSTGRHPKRYFPSLMYLEKTKGA